MGSTTSQDLNLSYNQNSRIGLYAKTLMDFYKDNIQENGRPEVMIDLDSIGLNLNPDDIKILEGIILASGYDYYEVSASADSQLLANLTAIDADPFCQSLY